MDAATTQRQESCAAGCWYTPSCWAPHAWTTVRWPCGRHVTLLCLLASITRPPTPRPCALSTPAPTPHVLRTARRQQSRVWVYCFAFVQAQAQWHRLAHGASPWQPGHSRAIGQSRACEKGSSRALRLTVLASCTRESALPAACRGHQGLTDHHPRTHPHDVRPPPTYTAAAP